MDTGSRGTSDYGGIQRVSQRFSFYARNAAPIGVSRADTGLIEFVSDALLGPLNLGPTEVSAAGPRIPD